MPYIGNPSAQRFTSPRAASVFSGDGSTTAFTLEEAVATDEDILVSVDGVIQEPSVAYAVSSGTTLTFTAAPSSNAGNNIFVYYIARTLGSVSMPDGQNVNAAVGTFSGTLDVTGAITSSAGATITTADNTDQLTLTSTDADANIAPTLNLKRDSSSPADNDFVGKISFSAENDASEEIVYANIQGVVLDVTDGTEDGRLRTTTVVNGSNRNRMDITSSEVVFNEDSIDSDFRIESDSDASMFLLDAGTNKIKIGTGATDSGYVSIRSTIDDGQSRAIYAENYQDGNPSANDVVMISAQYSNFTGSMLRIHHEVENANQLMIKVDTTGSNTVKFSVDEDGDVQSASNSYGSTSDERIKQDIVDANSQWDDIKAIKIRNYKRKTVSNPKTEIGVIAQELETAGMDGLVKESNPSVADIEVDSSFGTIVDDDSVSPNPDGSKKRKVGEVKDQVKEVKYSVLYMKAIKALQEAMTRIETLEAKVKVLEG